MHKANKFLAFFNIQPGEEHLIGLLVLLAFALELALVLLQSMAFGLFLEEYGQQSLPYSYIVIAVFGTLAAVISIKAAERVSFSMALMLNILFLGVFSTFIWLGLKSTFFHPVVFILPLSSLEENAMVSPAAPDGIRGLGSFISLPARPASSRTLPDRAKYLLVEGL